MVIDAREVRLKAHRPVQENDRRDAHELREGLRRGIYRVIVHVAPPAVARLRDTLSRRRHFVRVQTAEINAVKRLLRAAGLGHLSRSLRTEVGWAKLLSRLGAEADLRAQVEQHRSILAPCGRTADRLGGHACRAVGAICSGAASPAEGAGAGTDRRGHGDRRALGGTAFPRCQASSELCALGTLDPTSRESKEPMDGSRAVTRENCVPCYGRPLTTQGARASSQSLFCQTACTPRLRDASSSPSPVGEAARATTFHALLVRRWSSPAPRPRGTHSVKR